MKNNIKATILALAVMGGAAHAQSTTPGSAVDINVSVGATCSLTSKTALNVINSPQVQSALPDFFRVRCNKNLPHKIVFSGPAFYNSDQLAKIRLTNENGREHSIDIQLPIGADTQGNHTTLFTPKSDDWNYIGSGKESRIAIAYKSSYQNEILEVGTYTANVTATVEY